MFWRFNLYTKNIVLFIACFWISSATLLAQNNTKGKLVGSVVDTEKKPIAYAHIWIKELNRGTSTNEKGIFAIKEIPVGEYNVEISSLGFVKYSNKIKIKAESNEQTFVLKTKSYALKNVNVTATQDNKNYGTSYNLDIDAIEHEQVTNLTDVMTLLPGGQTFSKNLVTGSRRRIAIRSERAEADSASFGTAIEVDGIRLSNNAEFNQLRGVDARIIPVDNIESIQVTTGMPSVEYGDLTSGLIRVKTKSGVTPFNAKMSSTPRQKHVSISKGIIIGNNAGILNISYDFTKSNSNIASPYTSYMRNAFTLRHKKIFSAGSASPLTVSSTIAGNIGGYNSKADPDEYKDSYKKQKAMNIRTGFDVDWQLNKKLISNVNLSASVNYTDNEYEHYYYKSNASSSLAFHGIDEGYFVGQQYDESKPLSPIQILARGHWHQTKYNDSKPINYAAKLKMNKIFTGKKTSNKAKFGIELSGSGNLGKGKYYANREYTPSWHEHQYKDEPFLNNLAVYIEDKFTYRFNNNQSIILTAGLRNDYSIVKDARYKNVHSLSPRFNL